jgi:hypothetical protein
MFRLYLQTIAGSNNNRVVTLRCRNKHQNILVRKTANIFRRVLSPGRFRSLFQDFSPSGTCTERKKWPVLGKGDSGGELLAKDAAKTWFSRKEKRGNTDTWSDGKGNKVEKNSRRGLARVGEGLVQKMRREGGTDEGLVA